MLREFHLKIFNSHDNSVVMGLLLHQFYKFRNTGSEKLKDDQVPEGKGTEIHSQICVPDL